MFPILQAVHCPTALLPEGWRDDVRIEFEGNRIAAVSVGQPASTDCAKLVGPVIPGMANVHSHSFQRAMAGLAERRGNSDDNFWVWRDVMYQFAEQLEPDAIGAIADQLYTELLLNGYTSVGEFHYLHHSPDGTPYENRAELSLRHFEAARSSGIRLTHLPVLYSRGGFDDQPLQKAQKRFRNSVDELLELRSTLLDAVQGEPTISTGAAIHSLRAVSTDQITALIQTLEPCPIHIHVAEQTAEVEECISTLGARPIEWLLGQQPVDSNWCLIHATHPSPSELAAMAERQVVVGLCPCTEANLGDGIFPAVEFQLLGGRTSIGTDSHISTSVSDELRMLEYGQRLVHRKRNLLANNGRSVGVDLYEQAAANGARALGLNGGEITEDSVADLVVLRSDAPLICEREPDAQLDTHVFAGGQSTVRDVIVGGRHIVQNGRHPNQDSADQRFRNAMRSLSKTL